MSLKSYQLTVDMVIARLETNSKTGLTDQEAKKRLSLFGPNELPEKKIEPLYAIFLRQFQSPLIYILLAAAAIIFFVGESSIDAFLISGILFFNALVGTFQEGRARTILNELRRFFVSNSLVIRSGTKQLIRDRELVPGDIILLKKGEQVPADARLIECNNLRLDEAILTGESSLVKKNVTSLSADLPVFEQANIVFKGTHVATGFGKAVVVATGSDTEVGTIGELAEEIQTDLPIKQDLDRLSYIILIFVTVLCLLLFVVGIIAGRPFAELLTILTALFICIIPEGLPLVLTLVLIAGVRRMAEKNLLVRRLQAVEGLGRIQIIVTDKTGTLTRNEMMVSQICVSGHKGKLKMSGSGYFTDGQLLDEKSLNEKAKDNAHLMATTASLLNSSEVTFNEKTNSFTVRGDPTEAAMEVFSQKLGIVRTQVDTTYKKLYEIPFRPVLRYHAGFYDYSGQGILFINGSPEELMSRSDEVPSSMQSCLDSMLIDGLRVVGFAYKKFNMSEFTEHEESDKNNERFSYLLQKGLHFIGLCGIQDSIRIDVEPIVKETRRAGIKIIMATGDHQKTALYVARQVGIFNQGDRVINGTELRNMSDGELQTILSTTTVYSRLSPEDKLRIIQAFRKKGTMVAMTGDGINDIPALVAADIGIAMGSVSTEIVRYTADLVLLDDSFVHIITAIEEGRHIFYTLRRVILYFLSTNLAEILIIMFSLLSNLPLPLTTAQILWLNFITDGFLDVGLAFEPREQNLINRKEWLKKRPELIDSRLLATMCYMALPMGVGSLLVFLHYYQQDIALARTMTLLTMALFQWFNAWNCRSTTRSLTQVGFLNNKWLLLATVFVLTLQVLVVYVPSMQFIFNTVPLSLTQWIIVFSVASSIVLWEEIRKYIFQGSHY